MHMHEIAFHEADDLKACARQSYVDIGTADASEYGEIKTAAVFFFSSPEKAERFADAINRALAEDAKGVEPRMMAAE